MKELKILYLYPDILELYGDFGNIQVLKYSSNISGYKYNISNSFINQFLQLVKWGRG